MLKIQSHINIKDNSGAMAGRCINVHGRPWCGVGHTCTVTITKAKPIVSKKSGFNKSKAQIQDLLILQTKTPYSRHDGSFLKFSANNAVTYSVAGAKATVGFKRINTGVPFELKKGNAKVRVGNGLIKLAKTLI